MSEIRYIVYTCTSYLYLYLNSIIDNCLQIDKDMDDERDEDEELSEEAEKNALKKIREEIEENLEENEKIYLISSKLKYRGKYDFPNLRQDIATSLPDLKQEVLLRTLRADTKGLVAEKKKFLKKRILWYSLSSAAAGAVPIPGLDISADIIIFDEMITEQREQLGLTCRDLAAAASELGFSSADDLIKHLDKGST